MFRIIILLVLVLSNSVIRGQQQTNNNFSGLQLLLHINEGKGTTLYDSSRSTNVVTLYGTCAWVTGKIGSGLSMVNNGQAYTDKPSPFFTNSISQVSVFVWVYFNTITTRDFFFNIGAGSQFAMGADSDSGHVLRTYFNGTNPGGWLNTTTVVTSKKWHYLGFTYDGVTRKMYIDGVVSIQQAEIGTLTAGSTIGLGTYAGIFMNGIVDEVAVWDRALSPGEIKDFYNKGLGRKRCLE